MLEVVFSKSAEGSLKAAPHCAERWIESTVNACTMPEDGRNPQGEEMAKAQQKIAERRKKQQNKGESSGGNSRDVFCFADDLSIGTISGDCLSEERIHDLSEACSLFPEESADCLADLKEAKDSLEELIRRGSMGETIRIWYSEQPCEYCGVCWLLSELQKRMEKLPHMCTVKLPNRVESGNTIVHYLGWGEVSPEEFHQFLPLQTEVIPAFLCVAASKWSELQTDHAPLRAVINGTLQSVPEDFYDFFIRKEIDRMEPEFHEAALIGTILGKDQLGISDTWIAMRIEKIVEQGFLVPVTRPRSGDMLYRRRLRKVL